MKTLLMMMSVLALGSQCMAADFPANHCEAFVSHAVSASSGEENGGNSINVTLTVVPSRLDGAIVRVAQHYSVAGDSSGWKDADLFRNDDGTYEGGFKITDNFRTPRVQEFMSVFFVQTDKGTRYWVTSAKDNGNFFFTQDLLNHLPNESNVVLEYLNPNGCQ